MELVRYKPGEAIRWIQTGADNIRKTAAARGRSIVNQTGIDQRPLTDNVKTAAGAILDLGRSAYADLLHHQAEASEYVLQQDHFDIVRGTSIKTIQYERVRAISYRNEKATLTLDKGTLTIRPFAYVVAGRLKVPVGWSRNEIEVPFELLIEEIAARCRLEIEE